MKIPLWGLWIQHCDWVLPPYVRPRRPSAARMSPFSHMQLPLWIWDLLARPSSSGLSRHPPVLFKDLAMPLLPCQGLFPLLLNSCVLRRGGTGVGIPQCFCEPESARSRLQSGIRWHLPQSMALQAIFYLSSFIKNGYKFHSGKIHLLLFLFPQPCQ